MSDTYTGPGLGHNIPIWITQSETGEVQLSLELMREFLRDETLGLRERADVLLADAKKVPTAITDQETANKVSELVKMITACGKAINTDREKRKEPFLEGGRQVDAVFGSLRDPLATAHEDLRRRLTAYDVKVENERRRQLEEEARQRAEEEEHLRTQAQEAASAAATDAQRDLARATEHAADTAAVDAQLAREAAEIAPAELSRRRGDLGAVSSLTRFWDFRDIDRATLDLNALRPYISLDALEKALRGYIKAGGRKIDGAEIFENRRTQVR